MPRYEFKCPSCSTEVERTIDMNTIVKTHPKCPECGERMIRAWRAPQHVWKDGQKPK